MRSALGVEIVAGIDHLPLQNREAIDAGDCHEYNCGDYIDAEFLEELFHYLDFFNFLLILAGQRLMRWGTLIIHLIVRSAAKRHF